MQRRQGVCVLFSSRSLIAAAILCLLVLGWASPASAQVNTATLSGTVSDPQGLPVKGAKVTMTNAGTGAQRTSVTDDGGRYNLVGLPPGQYKMTVDGGASFSVYESDSVVLTVGESATLDPRLDLKSMVQTVTVSTETAPIETTKSDVSQTVEQRRIDNLPINGRSYINFTLTNSQTTRDVSPTIGPAPNSGLSIGGATSSVRAAPTNSTATPSGTFATRPFRRAILSLVKSIRSPAISTLSNKPTRARRAASPLVAPSRKIKPLLFCPTNTRSAKSLDSPVSGKNKEVGGLSVCLALPAAGANCRASY